MEDKMQIDITVENDSIQSYEHSEMLHTDALRHSIDHLERNQMETQTPEEDQYDIVVDGLQDMQLTKKRSHSSIMRRRKRAIYHNGVFRYSIKKYEDEVLEKKPTPSLMTVLRQLIALERFIDAEYLSDIRNLFSQTIEMEREEFNSSNKLINMDRIEFLHYAKTCIEHRVALSPYKPYFMINEFTRSLHRVTMQYVKAVTGAHCDSST